jgi:hypothetical protein
MSIKDLKKGLALLKNTQEAQFPGEKNKNASSLPQYV